jgi:hypothetical protein
MYSARVELIITISRSFFNPFFLRTTRPLLGYLMGNTCIATVSQIPELIISISVATDALNPASSNTSPPPTGPTTPNVASTSTPTVQSPAPKVEATTAQTPISSSTVETAPVPSAASTCGNGDNQILVANSQGDLNGLAGCTTFQGTLQLGSGFSGSAAIPDSIQALTGGFTASGVNGLTSVSASGIQSMGSIGSSSSTANSLQIQNNADLSSVQFPSLTSLGGSLQFAANPDLNAINGFNQLTNVGGNVDLTGNFQSVSLPDLDSVGGGINIQSTNPAFQCPSNIGEDRTNGVVKGKGFVCAGNIKNPTPGVTGANYTANTFPAMTTSGGKAILFQQTGISCVVDGGWFLIIGSLGWVERMLEGLLGLHFVMV